MPAIGRCMMAAFSSAARSVGRPLAANNGVPTDSAPNSTIATNTSVDRIRPTAPLP